jgi:hypothetical protein
LISAAAVELTGIEGGQERTYTVVQGIGVDPYSVRLGNRVRLTLDSMEIEDIFILTDTQMRNITGTIRFISNDQMTIENDLNRNEALIYNFLESVTIFDINTGIQRNISALRRDQRVYVEFVVDSHGRNMITGITILGNYGGR